MNKNTVKLFISRKPPMEKCVHCGSDYIVKNGRQRNNKQRYLCMDCNKSSNERSGTIFFHKKTSESKILKIVYLFLTGYPISLMVPFFQLNETTIRRMLNDAVTHFSRIQDFQPKPEDYEPKVIMFDEIYVKLQGHTEFYGWLAYDPVNKYLIAFQIGRRDDETLEKLFKQLKVHRGKVELVVIDGYQGYEKLIKKYLSGKGKHQRPTVGVINKSRFNEKENRFETYALWAENPRKAERLMRKYGLGTEITISMMRLNAFLRDTLAYMRRRTRRISRLLEWVNKAFIVIQVFHNCIKAHWSLSLRKSKNWIKEGVTPSMSIGIVDKQFSIGEILAMRVYPH